MTKQLAKNGLAKAIETESARLDDVEAKANAISESADSKALKARHDTLHNVAQRRKWLAELATVSEDAAALYRETLPNWAALVAPSDLYNVTDAAHQFVQAACGRGALRTAFRDFLQQFAESGKAELPSQHFRNGKLRRLDGVTCYTGDTALRWARGCAKALATLGGGAVIEGRADAQVIRIDPEARIIRALTDAKVANLTACK